MNKEFVFRCVFTVAAMASIVAVLLICLFLFANGIPAIGEIGPLRFLTGTHWRPMDVPASFEILPMILGSIYVTAGAILFGVPVGIFTSVFMAEMCPKRLYSVLKPCVNLLAGIPSVVYGFFGMVVLVPFVRANFGGTGASILTASILLGIMILPTIVAISESSMRAIPRELYDGALALGASRERAVFRVILPAAKSGVMASIVLGVGRAIGETMAVRMVAGNQALMRLPNDFLMGARTMTANIVLELGYATDLHRYALVGTGVVLFVFIMLINLFLSLIKRREGR